MNQDYDKYSALACLKETEGERVMKALKKIYDKMQTLEQAKDRRKQRVESLGKQTDHPSADDFCRRLAKAEAQCKLLEQQLSYVRKIVAQTHSEPQETVLVPDTQNNTHFDLYHLHDIPTKLLKEPKDISPLENFYPSTEETTNGTIGGFLNKGFAPKANSFATSTSVSLKNYPERDEAALSKIYNHDKSCGRRSQSQRSQITQMHFVPATTSSKSHSLRANMQVFHSMVKYCNPVLCSAAPLHRQRSLSAERHSQIRDSRCSRRMRSNSTSDLSNLIALTRTDEKGQRGRCRRSRSSEKPPIHLDQGQSTSGCNAHESNSILNGKKITNAQKKLILRNLQQVNEILKHCAST